MGKLVVPTNVTSITVSGTILVPDLKSEVTIPAGAANEIVPRQFQPQLISSSPVNGDVTVLLPPPITAISFAGVAYAADGQNQIVLPALLATRFLGSENWRPFSYYEPTSVSVLAPTRSFNLLAGPLPAEITFTRAGTATVWGPTGLLLDAAADTPRFDYDPITLAAKGLLIEDAVANACTNNTMVGGVAGSIGTVPTGWAISSGASSGLTRTLAYGVEDGIPYLDLRWAGTPTSATPMSIEFVPIGANQAAAVGEEWTESIFCTLVAGSTTGMNLGLSMIEYDAGNATLLDHVGTLFLPAAGPLRASRREYMQTLTQPTVAKMAFRFRWGLQIGTPVDATIRIGLPQLEKRGFASSPIKTVAAGAVTRNVDYATIAGANFTAIWNPAEGTFAATGASRDYRITSSNRFVASSDGTSSNAIVLSINKPTSQARFGVSVAGVSQATLFPGSVTLNNYSSAAGAWKIDNFAAAVDGSQVLTDSSGAIPVLNAIQIGTLNGVEAFNGWLKSVKYWNTRLPDEQLQAVTAQ